MQSLAADQVGKDHRPQGPIGIIGGSGLYSLLDDAEDRVIDTPYGAPSSPVSIGTIAGRSVAFLTRHGRDHDITPAHINYRANLSALRELGCQAVIASSAVGSLHGDWQPGDFVLCDQFIDRTSGRADTFFDAGRVVHVSMADPYCPSLRASAAGALRKLGERFHPSGCAVVIGGPRFSTRAESAWYAAAGADVLSMTQYPEAALAREAEMCCVNLSFISDADTEGDGDGSGTPVTAGMVWRRLAANTERVRAAIAAIVDAIDTGRDCRCRQALADT